MGYWSTLHLIDIRFKTSSLPVVKKAFRKRTANSSFQLFFDRGILDEKGFLCFKSSEDGHDPYIPDEDDGTVPALYGKWDQAERIAKWLKPHCRKGGRIVLHSIEADGEAWGWEFDGRGKMRELNLCPNGEWQ